MHLITAAPLRLLPVPSRSRSESTFVLPLHWVLTSPRSPGRRPFDMSSVFLDSIDGYDMHPCRMAT